MNNKLSILVPIILILTPLATAISVIELSSTDLNLEETLEIKITPGVKGIYKYIYIYNEESNSLDIEELSCNNFICFSNQTITYKPDSYSVYHLNMYDYDIHDYLEIDFTVKPKQTTEQILEEKVKKERKRVIVILKDKSQEDKLKIRWFQKGIIDKKANLERGFSAVVDEFGFKKLKEDPNVLRIEEDLPIKSFLLESTNITNAIQVHNKLIDEFNITGKDQSICIIDTGVNKSHLDLIGRVIAEKCYCSTNEGNSEFCCPNQQNEDESAIDNNGHGSHVAGVVAANGNIVGMAPEANMVAVKTLNSTGDGYSSDVINAIYFCTTNAIKYNISAISLSLGGELYETYCDDNYVVMSTIINNAVADNIAVIVATGNSNSNTLISFPACIKKATAVAATSDSDEIAPFSNRNNITDLAAPGVNINSINNLGGYITMSGTSMATPHVAGAIVLLQQYKKKENNSMLTVEELESVLNQTGFAINDTTSNLIFKRIDVLSALKSIDTLPPKLIVNSPENKTYFNQTSIELNFINLDTFLNLTYYTLDNQNITLIETSITLFNLTFTDHILNLYSKDLNNNTNQTTISFTITDIINIDSDNDGVNNTLDECPNTSLNLSVNNKGCAYPIYSKFNNNLTTNFTLINDLKNVTNLTVAVPNKGEIIILNQTNVVGLNLDDNIEIEQNRVSINITALQELNKSTRIIMYNVTFTKPQLKIDGNTCTICKSADYSNNTYTFEVSHF